MKAFAILSAVFFIPGFTGWPLSAQDVPYATAPDWISDDQEVSTGAALADIDQDGWPDLVVANGNDIYRQRLVVYYNQGGGVFPGLPDWESDDVDYHGHLSVGDVNGDGYPDVAVSVYIGPAGFSEPGKVKLYMNDGSGTLGATPAWTAAEDVYTFRCAFGDPDLDGDLDLAVACGESYYNRPRANRIFRNTGGMLETTPFWTAAEVDSSYDVAWADMDLDGDLDLAFCNNGEPNRVYFNNNGVLATTAGWNSTDASLNANTLAWGDVTGDGYPELAVADNNQEGGSGRFKYYLNNGAGQLGTTPAWESAVGGYGSSVVFSDIDDDGDLDLATGQWFNKVRIYLNNGGTLPADPAWQTVLGSVVERICFGDTDRDGQRTVEETFTDTDGRTVHVMSRRPLESITSVEVGGTPLAAGDYCAELENGWVSLRDNPGGQPVVVHAVYSVDQEMAVSNWDSDDGNYLFINTRAPSWAALILTGPGPGPDNPPEVRGFSPDAPSTAVVTFSAYGVDRYGVNVAAGEMDGSPGMEIITGPGPGTVFGPNVRTFDSSGLPVAGGSFLAYGTNKYGVKVAAGDLDGDGRDEFITTPGPGAVFGPHVRGFSMSGASVDPVPGVSFLAYGTNKYGANAACGDLDGDGIDEIVTGPGPGAVFGPHVRGFNVDGGAAGPMSGVSFFAYGTPRWGVNVACGDVDGDGFDEIVTGAGPGPVFGPHVRGFNVDNGSSSPISALSFLAYGTNRYGVQVGCGDLDGDGIDEIITAPGPSAAFGAQVRGWNFDGSTLTAIEGLDFFAYSASNVRYGALVAVLDDGSGSE